MNPNLFQHKGPERSSNPRDWEAARLEAASVAEHQANWNGEGAVRVPQRLIDSAVSFFRYMERRNEPAPDSVYPLPSGAVMAEWHYADGTAVSAEIREAGKAEILVWHPDRPSVFEIVKWVPSAVKPYRRAATVRMRMTGGYRPGVERVAVFNLPGTASSSDLAVSGILSNSCSSLMNPSDEQPPICLPSVTREEQSTDGESFTLAA